MSKTINDSLNNLPPVPFEIQCNFIDSLEGFNLYEMPLLFVTLIYDQVANTGKHIDDLTIKELRNIISSCSIATKKASKLKKYWWSI